MQPPKIRMSSISRNVEMCCWLLLYLHTTTTVQRVTYIRIKINNFLINILETGCLIKKLVSPLNFLGNWCGNYTGKNLQSHGVLYIIIITVFCKFFFRQDVCLCRFGSAKNVCEALQNVISSLFESFCC